MMSRQQELEYALQIAERSKELLLSKLNRGLVQTSTYIRMYNKVEDLTVKVIEESKKNQVQ
jgi:sugar-specific transcriptional regulator TrmB